jgi:hypothetical protein
MPTVRRYARRLPGFRFLRRTVLPKIRRSPTVRQFARRVFDIDVGRPAPMDVSAGNLLGGVGTESLPVVLVVIVGTASDQVSDIVDEVARHQLLGAGFRPVIVMDSPNFGAIRSYGYPVEHVIDRHSWVSDSDASWMDYVSARLQLLFDTYRATASIGVGPAGLDTASRLILRSLRAAHARPPQDRS